MSEALAIFCSWASWLWTAFFVVLLLFFVDFRSESIGGQTYYEYEGATALLVSILLMVIITVASVIISIKRMLPYAMAAGIVATIAVMAALMFFGPFLVPAAFGYALAAIFMLIKAQQGI